MKNFKVPDIISKIEKDLADKIESTALFPDSPAPEDLTILFEEYEKS